MSEQNRFAKQRIGSGNMYHTLRRRYTRNSGICLKYRESSFEHFFCSSKEEFMISLTRLFEMSANDRWARTSSGKNVAEFPGTRTKSLEQVPGVNISSFRRCIGNINFAPGLKHSWSYLNGHVYYVVRSFEKTGFLLFGRFVNDSQEVFRKSNRRVHCSFFYLKRG